MNNVLLVSGKLIVILDKNPAGGCLTSGNEIVGEMLSTVPGGKARRPSSVIQIMRFVRLCFWSPSLLSSADAVAAAAFCCVGVVDILAFPLASGSVSNWRKFCRLLLWWPCALVYCTASAEAQARNASSKSAECLVCMMFNVLWILFCDTDHGMEDGCWLMSGPWTGNSFSEKVYFNRDFMIRFSLDLISGKNDACILNR